VIGFSPFIVLADENKWNLEASDVDISSINCYPPHKNICERGNFLVSKSLTFH